MPDVWLDVDAALEVFVNAFPLLDDTDFKTREVAITYDQAGMDLVWNFQTTAGVVTQTAVTPTTAGVYDWTHVGDGMYKIEIPASGGGSINNDTEGFGWFSGIATGVLPWRSPIYGFRAAGINNALVDAAFSTTRGFSGTALPDADADAAGGLPISDAGGYDIDNIAAQVWDSILTGATHNIANSAGRRLRGIQEFQGYEDGAIWIDTINGTAGTTDFENGTVENPVDSIADANTISASLNINRFRVAPGSAITLTAAQQNQEFVGSGWTLALGGQNIDGSSFEGATVSGIGINTSGAQYFTQCTVGAVTLPGGTYVSESGIAGTQTAGEAGDYFYDRCYSAIAGTATWVFEFGDAIGDTNLNMRNYSGGVQLESMGDTGTDTASIEGQGQIIEGTCAGGTVSVRGNFSISGETNITFTTTANITSLAATLAALNDLSAADILTTALTEAYAADGAAPTLSELLFLVLSLLSEMSYSGTTGTAKKLDGSTTAATFTLDDATNPTSITRAT